MLMLLMFLLLMMPLLMMMMLLMTVDYILKDPTERERLSIHETPRVYPQGSAMSPYKQAV